MPPGPHFTRQRGTSSAIIHFPEPPGSCRESNKHRFTPEVLVVLLVPIFPHLPQCGSILKKKKSAPCLLLEAVEKSLKWDWIERGMSSCSSCFTVRRALEAGCSPWRMYPPNFSDRVELGLNWAAQFDNLKGSYPFIR